MLDQLLQNTPLQASGFQIETVILSLVISFGLGIVIALVYKTSRARMGSFAIILAILPMLVAAIIMIVNGNLGTSVAILGAFGLVRFRSAPGSAREIGFLFFALAVGLAAGMSLFYVAGLITVVVSIAILVLEKLNFGTPLSAERELRITIPEDLNYNGIFDDLFFTYTKKHYMERVKTTNMGTMYELAYRLEMRDPAKEKDFIDEIRCRNGNLTVTLGLVQPNKNEL